MNGEVDEVWPEGRSVLLTSFWGWSPETWGTVGWTGLRGETRRANLMAQLTDPFITVCYATANRAEIDKDLKSKVAGFYLVSHDMGDRDQFTHPLHHGQSPERWRHSNRAIRAFSYLPEYRREIRDYDPTLLERARSIAAMGEIVTDPGLIAQFRNTPWVETEVYSGSALSDRPECPAPGTGFVQPGPANRLGYFVESAAYDLPRRLYILRLHGDEDAYLGTAAQGKWIVKVGLASSPELRRQAFHKAMPRGRFVWEIERTSGDAHFERAQRGETAMKRHLSTAADHLGSEFYLADPAILDDAWQIALAAAGVIGEGKK